MHQPQSKRHGPRAPRWAEEVRGPITPPGITNFCGRRDEIDPLHSLMERGLTNGPSIVPQLRARDAAAQNKQNYSNCSGRLPAARFHSQSMVALHHNHPPGSPCSVCKNLCPAEDTNSLLMDSLSQGQCGKGRTAAVPWHNTQSGGIHLSNTCLPCSGLSCRHRRRCLSEQQPHSGRRQAN
jgi:hypothetical protein